jgi:hypothetical protein
LLAAWLVVLVCAVLTVVGEVRRAERPTAVPVFLLGGALLVMQAFVSLPAWLIGFSLPPRSVLAYTPLPGCTVGPLGAVLVAVGGWLRSHPQRRDPSRKLAVVPGEC